MKVPLVYPKIPDGENCPLKKCIAFEKLDGTNIHFVYQNGVCTEFGTRRDRFSMSTIGLLEFIEAHPGLETVIDDRDFIITIDNHMSKIKAEQVILFMEYCGVKSFAGTHQPRDDKKLYLIDAQVEGKILSPESFLKMFAGLERHIPKIVYKGKYTGQFVEDVRRGKYTVTEGVVCKGVVDGTVHMVKIKTNAYMKRLKDHFKDDWKNYWE